MTLHGSGIHPGGITERFPLMISSLSSAITHVRAEEFSDIRTYNAPDVVRHIMGFGGTPEEAIQGPMASLLENGFKMSVRMIADHMGFRIEPNIRTIQDIAVATADIDYGPFTITPGTVAARRFRWQALADGEPVITAAVNWLMGEENLEPAWNFGGRGERFEVEITGDPTVNLTFKGLQPETIAEGLQTNPGVVATANHCVNAIPDVCAAEPGIKTYLDLPLFAGRPAPSSLEDTMTVLHRLSFCHLVIGVTDMDRALAFYRDVLGMDVVFETLISGEPFDAVLHANANRKAAWRRPAGRTDDRAAVAGSNPPRTSRPAGVSPATRTSPCRSSISTTPTGASARPATRRNRSPSRSGSANVFRQGPGRNPGRIHRAARWRAQHLRDAPWCAAAVGTGRMSYTHPDSMRGHVAIITGGAQGVGKGIAAALLERGAAVLLVDILEEKLAATTDELKSDRPRRAIGRRFARPAQRRADRRGSGRRLRCGARAGQQRHRHQRAQGVRRHHR